MYKIMALCSNINCKEIWYALDPETWADDGTKCVKCGAEMLPEYATSNGPIRTWPENGITLEHVAAQPVHFPNKSDARDYAKKHNLELGCL